MIKYVAGIDNDGTDTVSQLDVPQKDFKSINWEKVFPKLKYNDRKKRKNDVTLCMELYNAMSRSGLSVMSLMRNIYTP